MRLKEEVNQIIIEETPGCLWIAGLFFAVIGGMFVYGSLGGFTDYDKQPPWVFMLTFIMGSAAVAVGIWIIYCAPVSKIVVDRLENQVSITRYGLFGRRENIYRFDEIKYFRLIEGKDDEGEPIWSFGIELTNAELIKITSLPSHSEDFERKYVFQTNRFINRPLPSYQTPDELEDESRMKMS